MAAENSGADTGQEQQTQCNQDVESTNTEELKSDQLKPNEQQGSEGERNEQELADMKDRYLRLMADFENFKKRALKEQSELLKYQGERVVVDLLEVLDNLELALAHSSAEYDKLKQGLEMVHRMFVERLGRWEIRGESSVGRESTHTGTRPSVGCPAILQSLGR